MKRRVPVLVIGLASATLALGGCSPDAGKPREAPAQPGPRPAPAKVATLEELEAAVAANPLKEAYFGETHVHTSYSLDAYIGGARITPDEAYRFAKGQEVTVNGQKHSIGRPLDFVAVSDHAEFMARCTRRRSRAPRAATTLPTRNCATSSRSRTSGSGS